jgi:hypothetical protein
MHRKTLARALVLALGIGAAPLALAVPMAGISNGTTLVGFDSATPSILQGSAPITGLQAGETIVGIDVRPANGQIYGIGSTSRLYRIDATTAQAVAIGGVFATPLSGTAFGVDFNPTVDRIRVVSDTDQNLRINPDTGAIAAVDTAINPATNDLVGAAYSNNVAGATSTTLFVIDSVADTLLTQGSPNGSPTSPNTGTVFPIGPLGVNATGVTGFDISGAGVAYLSINSVLYTVNLTTGAATAAGTIGAAGVGSITVVPQALFGFGQTIPTASRGGLVALALGLLGIGLAGAWRRRAGANV